MSPASLSKIIVSKLLQYLTGMFAGIALAIETAIPAFIPCLIITLIDIYSAYSLGRRVHKLHPDRSDGKFKSEYKNRILKTMLIVFLLIIVGNYVDEHILRQGNSSAVRFVMGVFIFYQGWSILENWSSENTNPMAKILQKIMINKAERHLNIDLSDLKQKEDGKTDPE